MIIVRSPLRISYFGGGTDLPKWYENNNMGGAVIASAINKYSYINIRFLEKFYDHKFRIRYFKNEEKNSIEKIEHPIIKSILKNFYNESKGLEIIHNADLPARSGLGSSSAFTNGLLKSLYFLKNKKISNSLLWKETLKIERLIDGAGVGSQDQITTAIGGSNFISFKKNNIKITQFTNLNNINFFIKHCSLFFLGFTRNAKKIELDKVENMHKKQLIYEELFNLCIEAKDLFKKKEGLNLNYIGELLRDQWDLKKNLSKKVTNSNIDDLYEKGLRSGAIGGKILGAGGGGFFIFLSKNMREKKKLIDQINKIKLVNFDLDKDGTKVIYNSQI